VEDLPAFVQSWHPCVNQTGTVRRPAHAPRQPEVGTQGAALAVHVHHAQAEVDFIAYISRRDCDSFSIGDYVSVGEVDDFLFFDKPGFAPR
jgi:hypothetical protein